MICVGLRTLTYAAILVIIKHSGLPPFFLYEAERPRYVFDGGRIADEKIWFA